jgi:FkbH-like protein
LDGQDLFADILARPFEFTPEVRREMAANAVADLDTMLRTAGERLPNAAFLINTVVLPPRNALSGLEYNTPFAMHDLASTYNEAAGEMAQSSRQTYLVDTAGLAAWMGYRQWHDPRLWNLARVRWSRMATKAVARAYANAVQAYLGRSRKCLVLDLDNTLWGGVIGEDGLTGIVLGEEGAGLAFAEFQTELKHLLPRGVLLAVCSKNNPDDALQALRNHPSMRLKEQDFACLRINWEDKAANLQGIAEELNIGLDSLVFIDDNPAERSRIATALPQVAVPDWPEDPADYKAALLELVADYFPKLRITEEDRKRGDLYRAQGERRKLAGSSSSMGDFYRSLQMRAVFARATDLTIPRIAQLTQKTNQFNLTTRRYGEPEIRSLARSEGAEVLSMELSDRFGSNGLIGVLILVRESPELWRIDTFLLSCRVIGRTAEDAFVAFACAVALERGAGELLGEYRPTERNSVASSVYSKLGFRGAGEDDGATLWRLNLRSSSLKMPEWIEAKYAAGETVHAE